MKTQDAPAEIIFKLWPWLEASRKRLAFAGAVLAVAALVWYYMASQQTAAALAAGQAYTQFELNLPPKAASQQVADGYRQVAAKYPGTLAGQRAQLTAGAVLFDGGGYPDAQAQFQNFLAADKSSSLAVLAQIGVAASLEAQGKLDAALQAWRAVVAAYPESTEVVSAKLGAGRVLELQGKPAEALNYYQEVARSPLAGSLGNEAAQRIALIQAKMAATKPAAKS